MTSVRLDYMGFGVWGLGFGVWGLGGTADLERAVGEVKPSTTAWLHTARNFAEFSNEGGVYDELLTYLRQRRLP